MKNYDATIRELEEKRDFYAAAAYALRQIASHEAGDGPKAKPAKVHRGGRKRGYTVSPEARQRMIEGQRRRREKAAREAADNGANLDSELVQ